MVQVRLVLLDATPPAPAAERSQFDAARQPDRRVVFRLPRLFIHLGQLIHPRSVAAAAAALDPSVVEVLEGGVSHEATADDVRTSESLRRLLLTELRRALPRARVLSAPPRPADVDFLRLARAPMLVTAGGSYAIAAAVASSSEHVRTPAAVDTNFPQRGAEPVRVVRPGWVTYAYDSWTDPKMLRTSESSR